MIPFLLLPLVVGRRRVESGVEVDVEVVEREDEGNTDGIEWWWIGRGERRWRGGVWKREGDWFWMEWWWNSEGK